MDQGGITRDRLAHKLCYTVGIFLGDGEREDYDSIRENSPALLNSQLYKTISSLIAPYEHL